MTQTVNFNDVFRAELDAIRDRHNKLAATKLKQDNSATNPTTALELAGITCSGGGIRSASFCLGVYIASLPLQALFTAHVTGNFVTFGASEPGR